MNSTAVATSGERMPPSTTYCEHASARRIRVYMPYAEANTLRLRAAHGGGSQDAHVSLLYAIPGGWGWTICPECRSVVRKSA